MNDRRTPPPDSPNRLEAELRSLPSPPPDPGFQARLRAGFAAGDLEPRRADEEPGAAFPDSPPILPADPRPLDLGSGRPVRRRPAWRLWLVPAALTAAVLLLYFLRPTPPDPGALAVFANGSGEVRVGDQTFAIDQVERYAGLLRPGAEVSVDGDMSAELQLQMENAFTLVAVAGAEFTVPQVGEGGRTRFRLDLGEVRIATLPGLVGERIEVSAPGTRVDVLGTTLAVIADAASTCVCLLEGTAMMRMKSGGMLELEPGMRRVMYIDPSTPDEVAPIFGDERMKLEMLRDAVGPAR